MTALRAAVLRAPVPRPRSLPRADDPASGLPEAASLLVVQIADGLGVAPAPGSGRAARAVVEDDLAPLLAESDLALIDRFNARARRRLPEINRGGVAAAALAAVDVALWDLKAKAAGLPLWKLLGGGRTSTAAHFGETAWPGLSADQVVELARPALDSGLRGLRVGVGSGDAIADAQKLQRVRDDLGEEVWFGVSGGQAFDVPTALAFGRFLEEELDADLFEDPIPAADLDGYARLAASLELPVAAGAGFGADGFAPLAARSGVSVLRPNLAALGGITAALEAISLAASFHRTVVPCGLPLVDVHLACARRAVTAVEYTRWWEPVFEGGPSLGTDGRLTPSSSPGLGVTLREGALKRFGVA